MEDFEISYLKDEFFRVKGFGVEHHWKIFLDLFVIFIFIKIKIEILFLLESGFHRKFNQDSKAWLLFSPQNRRGIKKRWGGGGESLILKCS